MLGRHDSASETVCRLLEFYMYEQSHAVKRLTVHLPNNYVVYFQHGQVEEALHRAANQATKLTAWFALNMDNPEAQKYVYLEIQ